MSKMFTIWRFLIQLGWAKSLTWEVTTETEQRIFWFSVHTLKRGDNKVLTIIIGPISIMIGFV